jgi:hypothetical protein
MKSTTCLEVDTAILLRLVQQLHRSGGKQDLSEAISTAITYWIEAQSQLPPGADPAGVRGYQWKSLFLPAGTVLRSWSYGEHNYAYVEGDEIIHDGRAVTPNQFAQSFARTTRNAWSDLYVRRPGDKQFKLACRLRQELADQAKTQAPPMQPAPAAAPDASKTSHSNNSPRATRKKKPASEEAGFLCSEA